VGLPELNRTLNFGHRGASHEAPANTVAAFECAAEMGADGVELDVHLSKDRELVVIHDFSLEATTNGHGPVTDKTLPELKALDAGSWFSPAFAGQRIPILQEVFDTVGHRLLLNLELKARGHRDDGLADAVVRAIERNNLFDRIVVSSFSRLALRRVRQINPRIEIGYLYYLDPLLARRPWPHDLARPEALHPWYKMIDERYVRWAKGQGYRIHTWTVDEPAAMRRLADLGVEIIITNRPDTLRQVLLGG
jgi:glycerophosphoryl diester phosphodiesterase